MSRIIGFVCLGLAGISLILPAYEAPFVGGVSLLQNWHGWLILVLLAAAAVAIGLNKKLWGRIASGLALGVAVIVLVIAMQEFNQVQNQLGNLPGNNMSFGLSWSWYPLIAALVVFQLAPLLSRKLQAQ